MIYNPFDGAVFFLLPLYANCYVYECKLKVAMHEMCNFFPAAAAVANLKKEKKHSSSHQWSA